MKKKKLIITEKPSVAIDFVKALGKFQKKDGYFENDKYIISWAVGHLVELFSPPDYDEKYKKWDLEILPVIPDKFQYKIIDKTRKQFEVLKKLINRRDVEFIINAGDAGREGELIQRLIYRLANNKKPVKRFWTSLALTPEVIRQGLKNLRDSKEFDNLFYSGQTRQIMDWLIGMNGTMSVTSKIGKELFSVGRVQTAVLYLLYKRYMEIKNFTPEKYFQLYLILEKDNHNIKANYFEINKDGKKITQFFVKKDGFKKLEKIKNDIENFSTAVIKQLEKKNKKIQPPLLYNLTELQRDANKYFGFSAEKTLQIAQNLYEKHKLISYPRTESQYLGEKNFPLAKNKLNLFLKHYNYSDIVDRKKLNPANKRVFNDKKLTDHHALIPLNLPDKSLSPAEEKIFNLIVKRFISVFCKDHEYEAVNIVFQVKDYNFEANFKNISEQGWKKIYQDIEKENKEDEVFLKDIKQGDEFLILDRILQEKETRPPFHYTDSSLLKDMSDPAKYIKDEKLKEVFKGDTGLGTQSTRAGIIETLIKRDYARRKKRNIIITEKGIKLVEFLQKGKYTRQLLSPETTAQWEMALNTLQKKDIKELYDNCVNYVKNFVKEIALL